MSYTGATNDLPEVPATTAPTPSSSTSSTSSVPEPTATLRKVGTTSAVAAATDSGYPEALVPTSVPTPKTSPPTRDAAPTAPLHMPPTLTTPGILWRTPPTDRVPAKATTPATLPATQPDGSSTSLLSGEELAVPLSVRTPTTSDRDQFVADLQEGDEVPREDPNSTR